VIGAVVHRARQALPDADILVIDDGSTDDTAEQADRAGAYVLHHPFNLGIGGAVQSGLRFALEHHYPIVLRMDGDGQHDPSELMPLLEIVRSQQADVAFGSRFLEARSPMTISLTRRVGIVLFAWLVSRLTGHRATDTTSGLCVFNQKAIQTLAHYMPQDYPEVEGRLILHKAKLRSVELPARMHMRTTGVSSIDSWRSIYYAVKVLIAVVITAIKDISPPMLTEELSHADPDRATHHRFTAQPSLARPDRPTDPQAQAP
jgi:glycosyltransferase involved in cell wall biosynthesis